jgi:hypothetical protein
MQKFHPHHLAAELEDSNSAIFNQALLNGQVAHDYCILFQGLFQRRFLSAKELLGTRLSRKSSKMTSPQPFVYCTAPL